MPSVTLSTPTDDYRVTRSHGRSPGRARCPRDDGDGPVYSKVRRPESADRTVELWNRNYLVGTQVRFTWAGVLRTGFTKRAAAVVDSVAVVWIAGFDDGVPLAGVESGDRELTDTEVE